MFYGGYLFDVKMTEELMIGIVGNGKGYGYDGDKRRALGYLGVRIRIRDKFLYMSSYRLHFLLCYFFCYGYSSMRSLSSGFRNQIQLYCFRYKDWLAASHTNIV